MRGCHDPAGVRAVGRRGDKDRSVAIRAQPGVRRPVTGTKPSPKADSSRGVDDAKRGPTVPSRGLWALFSTNENWAIRVNDALASRLGPEIVRSICSSAAFHGAAIRIPVPDGSLSVPAVARADRAGRGRPAGPMREKTRPKSRCACSTFKASHPTGQRSGTNRRRRGGGYDEYALRAGDHRKLCEPASYRKDKWFCGLSPDVLKSFSAVSHLSTYPGSAVLFVEGQTPRGVLVLCSGRVKLSTTSRDGKILILKMAEPGEAWV